MIYSSVTFWMQFQRMTWRAWSIRFFRSRPKPDTRVLRYEHRNVKVEIAPSVKGLATIYDKDILIYCISQLMAKKNAGEPLAQTLHLNAHELMIWANRETSGDGYRRLKDAFERLSGTRITTNIKANGEEITEGFGLIESWRVARETKSGRMNSTHMPRALVNVDELSELLSVAKGTLYQWVYLRRIPFIKVGRCLRFDAEEVIASLLHYSTIGSAGKR